MKNRTQPSSNFRDVGLFHERFGLDHALHEVKPRLISQELVEFRLKFLQEELNELQEGYDTSDLAKIADSLVDLVYVALGTAHLHGLPWEELWAEVQRANMTKQRAERADQSARNSTFDVIKPPGWRPPMIHETLLRNGWPGPPLPISPMVT